MRLNETEMVKLLPAWMQEDGSDKGIATGCDIISRDAYARLKLLSRWDKIDQLNDAELDEMAWELNIQWYDSTAPIETKRAVIRNGDRVYAKLGTPYAVAQIIADLSRHFTLMPGDLIFTGTPQGVMHGYPADQKSWLKPGDWVEVTIQGIGTLRTTFC